MAAQIIIEPHIERIAMSRVPLDTISLARWLLGKVLVSHVRGVQRCGRIVETEAYLQREAACHAFRGATPRNRSLFLEHGHAYVYLCYGTSFMLNVVSEVAGVGSGVLLRALEPLSGIEHMRVGREHVRRADLARGPGRLAAAMRVNLSHDGLNLFEGPRLWIGSDGYEVDERHIGVSARIGLTKAADERLRFFLAGSPHLSGSRALNTWPAPPSTAA
jgi:DNA-3-methyladenine glycosylase